MLENVNNNVLEKSIIIAAHPDDEILWFSSIFNMVDEIIFCYSDVKSNPQWTTGRKQSLSEYPMKNFSCLGLNESEVFSDENFHNPLITKYGLNISKKNISTIKYIVNYYKLKNVLKIKIAGYQNVFTHNPWGEYGNEEHIQIYRVIKGLQEKKNFNIWFSNYCSNKSFLLMMRYISEFDSEYVTLKTNKKLSYNIRDLYKKNGCWTWYDDWKWFDEESFIKDETCQENIKKYGHVFPLNLIKVNIQVESKKEAIIFNSFVDKFLKVPKKIFRIVLPNRN